MAFWNSTGDERNTDQSPTLYIPLTVMAVLKKKYDPLIRKKYKR
jgi:hypothetical protein